MKRMTTILLALVLLLAMTATAYAQDTVTITVGDIDATVGDIVEVPVMISEGHYAVNGRIFLTYDPQILALQKVCPGEDNPYFEDVNTDILDSGYMWAFKMPREGQANFVFATAANTGNATGGVLYTLTFAVLRDAKTPRSR